VVGGGAQRNTLKHQNVPVKNQEKLEFDWTTAGEVAVLASTPLQYCVTEINRVVCVCKADVDPFKVRLVIRLIRCS
jgi:hypothetical protein